VKRPGNLQPLFEFTKFGVEYLDLSGVYLVIPAVERKRALLEPAFYGRMRVEVGNLLDDIKLAEALEASGIIEMGKVLTEQLKRRIRILEPSSCGGNVEKFYTIEQALHRTAGGVPAHDDVSDAQDDDRVLDAG